ncbi:MAG: PASTA domain-containing protein [Actinomycetota bacterium]
MCGLTVIGLGACSGDDRPPPPDEVVVPPVRGLSLESAVTAICGRGLTFSLQETQRRGARVPTVVGTTPPAGTRVPRGAAVTIRVVFDGVVAVKVCG